MRAVRSRIPLVLLVVTPLATVAPGPASAQAAGQATGALQPVMGLLGTGQFQRAADTLETITETEPENGRAWSMLGFAYRQLGRPMDAIAAYTMAVDRPGSGGAAWLNLGTLLVLHGDAEQGFEWLRKAKESGSVDITQVDLTPGIEAVRADPRYRALLPSQAEFADPFVEPARVLREWRGEGVNDQFGWIARNIGDVDGDGIADVTTSAPTHGEGGNAGRVYAYSSGSGALLWTADGAPGAQLGLGIEAAGDVDANGVPDVLAGAPGVDRAFVYSGDDGRVLLTLEAQQPGELFGRKVSDIGDADGDGHDDLLVGAPQNDAGGQDAGRAYVFSGADGSLLLTLTGEEAGDRFGSSGGGHVSADGRVTLVVGAPNAGPGDRGATYVYHGLTTEPAFVITSDEAGAQLGGMFVSAVGDVDADGVVDVYASDWSANTNGQGSGRVYVHSGATGERLYDLSGEAAGDGFGIGVADVGDVDGDGHDDLLIGAWQHGSAAPSGGKVYLYSGRDGTLVREITGKVVGETFGFDTTGMGDIDGDGTIDYLLTSAWSAVNGGRSGRMFIVSGAPGR